MKAKALRDTHRLIDKRSWAPWRRVPWELLGVFPNLWMWIKCGTAIPSCFFVIKTAWLKVSRPYFTLSLSIGLDSWFLGITKVLSSSKMLQVFPYSLSQTFSSVLFYSSPDFSLLLVLSCSHCLGENINTFCPWTNLPNEIKLDFFFFF